MAPSKLENIDFIVNPDPDGPFFGELVDANWLSDGWHCDKNDYKIWSETLDDLVMYGAVERDTRKAVSCVFIASIRSATNRPNDKFIGFYYTRPEYRGLGIGKALFDKLVPHMEGHNVGLAGAVKMSPVYAKCYGINKFLDVRIVVHNIPCKSAVLPQPSAALPPTKPNHSRFSLIKDRASSITLRTQFEWMTYDLGANRGDVTKFDRTVAQNIEREEQVLRWMQSAICTARIAYDNNGKVAGFCCIRVIKDALAMSPFYADSLEAAQTLLHDTLSDIKDWRTFDHLNSMAPNTCTMATHMFEVMNNGNPSGKPTEFLQFTDEIPAGYAFEKVYGILECSTNLI